MEAGKIKEKIKTVIIVVLFIQAILLLYLLWRPRIGPISIDVFSGIGGRQLPAAEELIKVRSAIVSQGNGDFTMLTEDSSSLLKAAEAEISHMFETGSPQTEEITADQYRLAMSGWRSVQLDAGCGLPLSDFLSYFCGYSLNSSADDIHFDVLAFSEASKESFFAEDRSGKKYYRIVFEEERDSVANILENVSESGVSCYLASEILGGDGTAMIPLSLESSLVPRAFASETGENSDSFADDIAEAVFGKTFDFVRRITDTYGNLTYMYGYGEKTLLALTDGSFSYSSVPEEGTITGTFDDLDEAVRFLSDFGGLDGPVTLVLEGFSESGAGKTKERTFEFVQTVSDNRVLGEGGFGASVTLTGGTVSECRRRLISEGGTHSAKSATEAAQPANVIASNANHIYNILNNNTLAIASDEAFLAAATEVSVIYPGFFASSKDAELIPCWILQANGGTRFYFDLYSASPLGFERRTE